MKLSDTQLIVLTAAAERDDGSILPLPATIRGGAITKVIGGLITRGLAERIEDERAAIDDLVRITRDGLLAIHVDPDDAPWAAAPVGGATPPPDPEMATTGEPGATPSDDGTAPAPRQPREGSKQATMIEMMRRPAGATLDEIVAATGWQRHTIRGAVAGALKKKLGLNVISTKSEAGDRTYQIPA